MIQQPQMYNPYRVQQQYGTSPQASAVNIQIFEPKVMNSPCGSECVACQPQYDNGFYQYPQNSLYAPNMQYPYQPMAQQQYQTQPQMAIMPNDMYVAPQQQQFYNTYPTNTYQPLPQEYNEVPPVLPSPQIVEQPQVQQTLVEKQPQAEMNNSKPVDAVQQVQIEEPDTTKENLDVSGLVKALNGTDLDAQTDAITRIAQLSQSTDGTAPQLVDEQVMQSLLGIIKKNTSKLEGPSKQQIAIAHKIANGEQLTPTEMEISKKSSPREIAEKNKVFAMFTLALLQKLLRDEVDTYNSDIQKTMNGQKTSSGKPVNGTQIPPLDIAPFVNEITNTITTSDIPTVKVAGLQALSYVANKPEDKQVLENAIGKFVYDQDANVSQAAKEALAKVGS